ncbi:MAG TPA: arginine--tRNA ligase [Anaerolineae bacterium]|nr:arginine--tRNA ligase [Anaerolineae bacterium]
MTFLPLRDRLAAVVRAALEAAQAAGDLPPFEIPAAVPVEPARHAAHGDYASPVCLGLARVVRRAPLQIAQALISHLPPTDFIGGVEAVAPGYLNFTLSEPWLAQQVAVILEAGERWGNVALGEGQRVQVEFVSANPTGPITIGSARNAVIGDTVAAVLEAAGYQVEREYYVNDAGSKARKLAVSVFNQYALRLGAPAMLDEETYPGTYIGAMAESLAASAGGRYLELERETALREIMRWAIEQVLQTVAEDLARLRVHFDTWRHERDFYAPGPEGQPSLFEQRLAALREGGYIIERDEALWFTHPDLDKDAVLIRSPRVVPNPEDRPTYLASDAAYVWDKLVLRGFDRAIYVWGADHHGDVPRLLAVTQAQGLDPSRVNIILYQMVTLLRGGVEVRMSKSSGEFVTLRELVDEVGPDPIRFMMLTRTVDVTLDFDLDLALEQSDRNPVYYVQYAHTRIAGVLRKATELGLTLDAPGDLTLLTHPSELALIRKMLALPEIIALAATALAPHHLTLYATELAALFHAFYRDCRVVDPEDLPLTQARLMLARAAQTVLARVLHLMGMAAPERM